MLKLLISPKNKSIIIQTIIVVLVFPGFFYLLNLISHDSAGSLLSWFADKIFEPIVKSIEKVFLPIDLITEAIEAFNENEEIILNYNLYVWQNIIDNHIEFFLISMYIYLFKNLLPGMSIISSVCGGFVGCYVLFMCDGIVMTFMVMNFSILLNLVLELVFNLGKGYFRALFKMSINSIGSGLIGGYISVLAMIFRNQIHDVETAITLVVVTTAALIIYYIIEFLFIK